MLLVRIFFTLSVAAPASNPLLADYIHRDSIGKAATLVGLGYIVGEVLSMGVLFKATASFNPPLAFGTTAIVGALFSLFFLIFVKEP